MVKGPLVNNGKGLAWGKVMKRDIDIKQVLTDMNVMKSQDAGSSVEDRKSTNFVRNGRVYILGDFDESIAKYVVPDLNEMISDASGQKDVTIPFYINSCGGESDQLQSILSLITIAKSMGINIMTFVVGNAYSCGSLLAIHGDVRLMARGARHMMHMGEIGSSSKTYEQLKRNNKDAKDFFDDTVKMYVNCTKMTDKQWARPHWRARCNTEMIVLERN